MEKKKHEVAEERRNANNPTHDVLFSRDRPGSMNVKSCMCETVDSENQ